MVGHNLYDIPGMEGLMACTTCHGAEGSLPSLCPGSPMGPDTQHAVHAGVTDFHSVGGYAGQWFTTTRRSKLLFKLQDVRRRAYHAEDDRLLLAQLKMGARLLARWGHKALREAEAAEEFRYERGC